MTHGGARPNSGGKRTPGEGRKLGRPRKAPADLASVRIVALATPGEAEQIDAARGKEGRGEFVLRAALRSAKRRDKASK